MGELKMRKSLQHKIVNAKTLLMGLLAMSTTGALADDFVSADGMIEATLGRDINEAPFMKDWGLTFGAWLDMGVTYNSTDPADSFNGPVTFNDRAEEFQLNQLNLFIERSVNTEGNAWDIGGRFDFMFGTDARFTQATGNWDDDLISETDLRFYDIALPQAYLEIFAPFGNGITARIGHFYTIIGNEVVPAPDNFFYSHAYTMQYGEPFTHTGVLFSTPINKNFSVTAGAVLGWDNFSDNGSNWNFLGGVNWTSDDEATSLAISTVAGDVDDVTSELRAMYSIVLSHNMTDKWRYVLQHDHGYQEEAAAGGRDADWYGVNLNVFYDVTDFLSAGMRAEWFRDDEGVRVAPIGIGNRFPTNAASFYAVTAGVNWKPTNWITVRPEVRYDWADGVDAFDAGNQGEQLLFATDVVILF